MPDVDRFLHLFIACPFRITIDPTGLHEMSSSRKQFLILLIVVIGTGVVSGLVYLQYMNDRGRTIVYDADESAPEQSVELRQRGREWFLVDEKRSLRAEDEKRYLNPITLSQAELKSHAEERWGKDNEWLAFRSLYLDYYNQYYEKRFDEPLKPTSKEIEFAYEYWKRRDTP